MKRTIILSLLCLAVLGQATASAQAQKNEAELWRALDRAMPFHAPKQGQQAPLSHTIDWDATLDRIGAVVAEASGTSVEPFALWTMGGALFSADRFDEAKATFEDLRDRFPKHLFVSFVQPKVGATMVQQAIEDCDRELTFRRNHKVKLMPKPEIDEDTLVVLHFTPGDVKVRFFKNVGQKTRENFLALVRKNFYDRLRVHKVVQDVLVQLGCPNTRDQPHAEWGKGSPGYYIDQEPNLVPHERGVLTMLRSGGQKKSHGSQFQILLGKQPHLDFIQTPFARVVDGLEILDRAAKGIRNQFGAPATDCWLNGVSVLTGAEAKQ